MKLNISPLQAFVASLRAGATAAIINGILFYIFHAAGVISDNIFPTPHQPMTLVPVLMASTLPLIMVSQVYYLLEYFTKNGFKTFTIVSLAILLLSLTLPFTVIPGITTGYALVLCAMHIITASSLLYFIRRSKNTNEIKRVKKNNASFQTI